MQNGRFNLAQGAEELLAKGGDLKDGKDDMNDAKGEKEAGAARMKAKQQAKGKLRLI